MSKLTTSQRKKLTSRQESTRKQVSGYWATYSRSKKRINSKKISKEKKKEQIQLELVKTRIKISNRWNIYRDFKDKNTKKLLYGGLRFIQRDQLQSGYMDTYQILRDSGFRNLFETKLMTGVTYIMLLLKIRYIETGMYDWKSDSFTKTVWEQYTPDELIEMTIMKTSLQNYDGYKLVGKFVKLVYANFKKD